MKVQIEMDAEFVARLDACAKSTGLNRSTFVKMATGEKIMTYENTYKMIERLGLEAINDKLKN